MASSDSDGSAAHAQCQRKWRPKRTVKSGGRAVLNRLRTGFSGFSVADFPSDKFMQMS